MENEQSFDYVGFWSRVWALLLDFLVFPLVTIPLLYAIHGRGYFKSDITVRGPIDFLNTFVLASAVIILCWIVCAATPGKVAVSAKIVDALTGKRPTPRQFIIRYLGYYLSAVPLGLGFLWVAFDSRKQGWHDKLAGTVVIRPKK
ncbi:MAG: RDD family protein [bacterium]